MTQNRSLIVKSREDWLAQASEALARLEAEAAEARPDLRACANLDQEAFSALIEALQALGQPLAPELLQLAQLRPVDQLL